MTAWEQIIVSQELQDPRGNCVNTKQVKRAHPFTLPLLLMLLIRGAGRLPLPPPQKGATWATWLPAGTTEKGMGTANFYPLALKDKWHLPVPLEGWVLYRQVWADLFPLMNLQVGSPQQTLFLSLQMGTDGDRWGPRLGSDFYLCFLGQRLLFHSHHILSPGN